MWPSFKKNPIPYNLRNGDICILPPTRSSRCSINLVQFRGSLLWNILPTAVKESVFVKEFKTKIQPYTKDSLLLCCISKFLKFLLIMPVLVFAKLAFVSLVTIVNIK